ncbi:MAG: glycosyltransferase family 2 protein [Eubacterium sp.]|nr:glycosyltransferase family 2 protein [Eubacterium sp.]
MILQNMIFPKEGICEENDLYFHVISGSAHMEQGELVLEPGTEISFLTYFNSFSGGKWHEYTQVHEGNAVLHVNGMCQVSLFRTKLSDAGLIRELVCETSALQPPNDTVSLPFTLHGFEWIYYVSIRSTGKTSILGGCFDTSATAQNPAYLAIGICTYRREPFVQKTLQTLRTWILDDPESALYGHVHVFVSDNGNTLPLDKRYGDHIHVVYNKNAGGSGGFGRCMLEALRAQHTHPFTHILLMDDDIILEPEAVFRTYMFLSLLQESYKNHLLGGSVLRVDTPYIQNENGANWNNGQFDILKAGYDLRNELAVVENENRLPFDYNGWWYCCIPMKRDFDRSLPLPVFIHIDDVEYSLRFHQNIITLNGISVWHGAFFNRRASSMEYYDMRNGLICDAIHHPDYSKKRIKNRICHQLIAKLLKFRYEDQNLILRGVEDFCKGVNFLKEQDPVQLHGEIMKMGYQPEDVSSLLAECHVETYYEKPTEDEFYRPLSFSTKQKLTLNGWLLPGKKDCIPIAMGAHPRFWYRCKKALLFDPDSNKGVLVKRSYSQLFVTLARCMRARRLIQKNYDRVVDDFQKHAGELMTKEFWEKYLGV